MLISKPKRYEDEVVFDEAMKAAKAYLPVEQIKKFEGRPDLLEKELYNEAREPEISLALKDLFTALHEHNVPKLLKVLQGDEQRLFYAFKKQLESAQRLTKREAKILAMIEKDEYSLLTIASIRD